MATKKKATKKAEPLSPAEQDKAERWKRREAQINQQAQAAKRQAEQSH